MKKIKLYKSKWHGWLDENDVPVKRECSKCGEVKLMEEFSPHSDPHKGFAGKRSQCKACTNATSKKNREKRLRYKPEYYLYSGAKLRAKKRGMEFDLTEEFVASIMTDTCPVLGIPMFHGEGSVCDNSWTLDRIDNTKGYTKDNVAVISYRANSLKGAGTLEELKALCEWLTCHVDLS